MNPLKRMIIEIKKDIIELIKEGKSTAYAINHMKDVEVRCELDENRG